MIDFTEVIFPGDEFSHMNQSEGKEYIIILTEDEYNKIKIRQEIMDGMP